MGTNTFDTSAKQRVPSWTDRILWKTREELRDRVKCDAYTSIPELMTSDHKPVLGEYTIKLPELGEGTTVQELDRTHPYDFKAYVKGNRRHFMNTTGHRNSAVASASESDNDPSNVSGSCCVPQCNLLHYVTSRITIVTACVPLVLFCCTCRLLYCSFLFVITLLYDN